jgi:hypothetical protein
MPRTHQEATYAVFSSSVIPSPLLGPKYISDFRNYLVVVVHVDKVRLTSLNCGQ